MEIAFIIVAILLWWVITTITSAISIKELKEQVTELTKENQRLTRRLNNQIATTTKEFNRLKQSLTEQPNEDLQATNNTEIQAPLDDKDTTDKVDNVTHAEPTKEDILARYVPSTANTVALELNKSKSAYTHHVIDKQTITNLPKEELATQPIPLNSNNDNLIHKTEKTALKKQLTKTAVTSKETRLENSQEPNFVDKLVAQATKWLTTGNVPVKIGMLVLIFAVIAFLRYATTMGWIHISIQAKLIGVAVGAFGALAFAWKKRLSKRSFSLVVQGGSIGIILLVIFSAVKMYGLMSPTLGFVCSVVMVLLTTYLSVQQNAKLLAVMAISAGFLAPIWLSDGTGSHVTLFGYYAILNIGIFILAWFKPWRELNLLGFVFTYVIGSTWGGLNYRAEQFNSTEPFVILFFIFYLLIPLRLAQQSEQDTAGFLANDASTNDDKPNSFDRFIEQDFYKKFRLDSALLFGTPLVTLSLQVALLTNKNHLAFSCVVMGLIYAVLAFLLRHKTTHQFFNFSRNLDKHTQKSHRDKIQITNQTNIDNEYIQATKVELAERSQHNLFNTLQLAYMGLAVSFLTLAVPIGLSAKATTIIFALEGAGAIWLSVRGNKHYRRLLTWAGGLILHLMAFIGYVDAYYGSPSSLTSHSETPIFNGYYLTSVLLIIAYVFSAWISYDAIRRTEQNLNANKNLAIFVNKFPITNNMLRNTGRVLFVVALVMWVFVNCVEITEQIKDITNFSLVFALFPFTAMACMAFYRHKKGYGDAVVWVSSCLLMMAGLLLAFLHFQFTQYDTVYSESLNFLQFTLPWLFYAFAGWWLWKQLQQKTSLLVEVSILSWLVTLVTMLSTEIVTLVRETMNIAPNSGWVMIVSCLPTFILMVIDCFKPQWLASLANRQYANQQTLPASTKFTWQTVASYMGMFVLVMLFTYLTLISGDHSNWWLPLLNSNDFVQVVLVALFGFWLQGNIARGGLRHAVTDTSKRMTLLACLVLFTISMITLRFVYHFTDSVWGMDMFSTAIVQMSLTLVWSILGVVGWIVGSKRLSKPIWLLGAVLMTVALVKLVLVDREHLGNLFGIASFFGYGLLCVIVGYFAPIPPSQPEDDVVTDESLT